MLSGLGIHRVYSGRYFAEFLVSLGRFRSVDVDDALLAPIFEMVLEESPQDPEALESQLTWQGLPSPFHTIVLRQWRWRSRSMESRSQRSL